LLWLDTWDHENFRVFASGVALSHAAGYDAYMKIENLARLCNWAAGAAAAAGVDPAYSEEIAAVVWRHAHGQGLRAGDDWSLVLDMYGVEQLREIAAAAADARAADRSRRRGS
jgi:hypothetical protein